MDNYFPGAFFTLVPFNPNPDAVNPSQIRGKNSNANILAIVAGALYKL